jgi:hypothetical protein
LKAILNNSHKSLKITEKDGRIVFHRSLWTNAKLHFHWRKAIEEKILFFCTVF